MISLWRFVRSRRPSIRTILGWTAPALGFSFAASSIAGPAALDVSVEGLDAHRRLPMSSAYCVPESATKSDYDVSPAVSWGAGPAATRSYALIMTDRDVPRDLSLVNRPGVRLDDETPRMSLIHWVLVDIPATIHHLARGAEGAAFAPHGKPVGPTPNGVRGANAYSQFYPPGSPLAGIRGGYDGPCPPRNDTKPHHYVTKVYALDVPSLGLSGVFYGEDALQRMTGHILAEGEADAIYGPTSEP